ncbi:hypothetical protein EUAN_20570 [Andreesenia angusta]|uniref:Uncharacterized protein n=1 Tax=Andreesenia angusta TaxID=39480 RepID=A0A1S1V5Z2_9FIRM|nr:hypothetical protein [Andreesenia angusta]OHW61517.1 hypothetical protein EUAN_20570 [Andreesenia angusta]
MRSLDLDFLKICDAETREEIVRKKLGEEKCRVLDKYGLTLNNRLYWEKVQEKYPTQEHFSLKLTVKTSTLGIIFHLHRLCFAKTKYFENNWNDYEPCKYIWTEGGFSPCELYDMEAIRQKGTGIVVDLRDLSRIKWLHEFQAMCRELEQRKMQRTFDFRDSKMASL